MDIQETKSASAELLDKASAIARKTHDEKGIAIPENIFLKGKNSDADERR